MLRGPCLFVLWGCYCRNLELILFGGQSLCVVVELGDEMPSPTDIQLAHTRLRALCLGGQYKPSAPFGKSSVLVCVLMYLIKTHIG